MGILGGWYDDKGSITPIVSMCHYYVKVSLSRYQGANTWVCSTVIILGGDRYFRFDTRTKKPIHEVYDEGFDCIFCGAIVNR